MFVYSFLSLVWEVAERLVSNLSESSIPEVIDCAGSLVSTQIAADKVYSRGCKTTDISASKAARGSADKYVVLSSLQINFSIIFFRREVNILRSRLHYLLEA